MGSAAAEAVHAALHAIVTNRRLRFGPEWGRRTLRLGMLRCPSLREIFLFPPSSGPRSSAGYALRGRAGRAWGALHEVSGKKSLTTGQARFLWEF